MSFLVVVVVNATMRVLESARFRRRRRRRRRATRMRSDGGSRRHRRREPGQRNHRSPRFSPGEEASTTFRRLRRKGGRHRTNN